MKGSFNKTNPKRKGLKCMVFVDATIDDISGRYIFGEIVDVFGEIITVEITRSTFYHWKKHDQAQFPIFQVWAESLEHPQPVQLSLF